MTVLSSSSAPFVPHHAVLRSAKTRSVNKLLVDAHGSDSAQSRDDIA